MSMPVSPGWRPPAWRVLIPLGILIVLLNVFDAVSTMDIVGRGGGEANPLARPMLHAGVAAFFFWKVGLAVVCAAALACLSRIRREAWWLSWAAVTVYLLIAGLHVYLRWFYQRP